MSDEILRILNTYDDEVAKALTLKHGCQPAWADAKSKAVKSLSTLLSQETAELKEEMRVGNILTAKFCDRCIDLEHQLAKRDELISALVKTGRIVSSSVKTDTEQNWTVNSKTLKWFIREWLKVTARLKEINNES